MEAEIVSYILGYELLLTLKIFNLFQKIIYHQLLKS